MFKVLRFLRGGNLLTALTVTGVGIGLGLGIGLRSSGRWSQRDAMYLKLIGDLFLRTLTCLMLPLIVSSLVTATGSLDLSLSKRIGTRAIVFYLSTSVLAAVLGTTIVNFVSPGTKSGMQITNCPPGEGGTTVDTLLDLVRNVFPPNLIGAALQNSQTKLSRNDTLPIEQWPISVQMVDGTNMLGIITFSLVLGITLGAMGELGKPLLVVFQTLANATLLIATKVIWAGPVAVIFLISGALVGLENGISEAFSNLSWYTGVMVSSFLLHGFIVQPILFFIFLRKLPFKFIKDIADAIFTAFGTASSSATLPITLKCLEENHKMDTRITRFLIPIGATVNMDGGALGVPLRVIYTAQLCGRVFGFGELVTITMTAVAASIGLAGIPGVGMIVSTTILGSIGIPADMIAYTLPVDWLQDRLGTVVNVVGDAYGAAIIGHLSKKDLEKVSTYAPPSTVQNTSDVVHKTDFKGEDV